MTNSEGSRRFNKMILEKGREIVEKWCNEFDHDFSDLEKEYLLILFSDGAEFLKHEILALLEEPIGNICIGKPHPEYERGFYEGTCLVKRLITHRLKS